MIEPSLNERIDAGVKQYGLTLGPSQLQQLTHYLTHLERWNRTINLTSLPLTDYPSPTLERLVFEPLRVFPVFGRGPFSWLDFGSGGGSPAIPLRIVLPAASLTMIESRSRKVAFLRDAVRTLGLSRVHVLWERVETLRKIMSAGSVDILTVRALRIDEGVSESVNHLLKESGRLILFGPKDWSYLAADFAFIPSAQSVGNITILERRAR